MFIRHNKHRKKTAKSKIKRRILQQEGKPVQCWSRISGIFAVLWENRKNVTEHKREGLVWCSRRAVGNHYIGVFCV